MCSRPTPVDRIFASRVKHLHHPADKREMVPTMRKLFLASALLITAVSVMAIEFDDGDDVVIDKLDVCTKPSEGVTFEIAFGDDLVTNNTTGTVLIHRVDSLSDRMLAAFHNHAFSHPGGGSYTPITRPWAICYTISAYEADNDGDEEWLEARIVDGVGEFFDHRDDVFATVIPK